MDRGLSPRRLEALSPDWVPQEAGQASQGLPGPGDRKGPPTPRPVPPPCSSAPSDSPPPVAQRLPRGRPPGPGPPAPRGAPRPSAARRPSSRPRPARRSGAARCPRPAAAPGGWQGRTRRSGRRPRASFIHPGVQLLSCLRAREGPAPPRTRLQTPLPPSPPPAPGPTRDQDPSNRSSPSPPSCWASVSPSGIRPWGGIFGSGRPPLCRP